MSKTDTPSADTASRDQAGPPDHFAIGDDLNWDAPWIDVLLWVELPFWLMVDNTTITVEVEGHEFPISVYDNYFELHGKIISDSRDTVCYRGPLRKLDDLSENIQQVRRENPDLPLMWRKCKTILKNRYAMQRRALERGNRGKTIAPEHGQTLSRRTVQSAYPCCQQVCTGLSLGHL